MNKPQFVGLSIVVATLFALTGCGGGADKEFLGSAVVECRTYAVATTVEGPITALYKDEGQTVGRGELVAVIDTVPLALQRREILADMGELGAEIASQETQNKPMASDVVGRSASSTAHRSSSRTGPRPSSSAISSGTQLQSLELRLSAEKRTSQSLAQRNKELLVKLAEVEDQLRRCFVASPANGIVLTRSATPAR